MAGFPDRRKPWRRVAAARGLTLALAIAAGAGLLGAVPRQAAAQGESKSAVLVLDANSGRILHQSSADAPRHPASLAKMMTIYLAFELMEQGRLHADTKIRMSANAAGAAPSKLGLEPGEEIGLLDAIKVLITKSANDVAIAVAEHIAGSEERFARLMTQKARQLGMPATTFKNASGLPDDEQVTTARDMMTLALRLQDDFPRLYPLFATRTFAYKDDVFRNHNTLLFHYQGTDGLKTGYTRASGFNLVASVRRNGKHVIGVVFGGASAASRNAAMRTYLNMGLVKASTERTRRPAPPLVASPLVARAAPARAPAPAPRILANVPTPQRVERPLRPVAAPAAEPAAPPATPAAAPPAAPMQRPPLAVEIARVRPVLVGPRAAAETPAPAPPDSIEALIAQQEPQQEPASVAAERSAMPRPYGLPPPAWASGTVDPAPMRLAAPAPDDRPALLTDAGILRGTLPSTFEQQAANLARGAPPVAVAPTTERVNASLRGSLPPAEEPVRLPPPARAEGFQIQIGAYQSEAEAQRQLALARERAPALLATRAARAQPAQQAGKAIYRARYGGFPGQAQAADACSALKRQKLDCFVVRGD